MKKFTILLAAIMVLVFSMDAGAQGKKSGMRAGYTVSNLIDGPGYLNGFYVGFSHDRPIGKAKLLWGHGGTEYTQAGYMLDENNYRRLHYLSFTNALKVKLGPVFVQGGYALNFKLAESYISGGFDAKTSANKYRVFNFPVHMGAGVTLGPVTVEARYNYGLSKLNRDISPDDRLSYLQVGAGLHF